MESVYCWSEYELNLLCDPWIPVQKENTHPHIELLSKEKNWTVTMVYSDGCASARVRLGQNWWVRLSELLIERLQRSFGDVSIEY